MSCPTTLPYNLTCINTSSTVNMLTGINESIMYDTLGIMILLAFSFIMFTGFYQKTEDIKQSIGITTLLTAILVIFLRNISLVDDYAVYIAWIAAAASGLVNLLWRE